MSDGQASGLAESSLWPRLLARDRVPVVVLLSVETVIWVASPAVAVDGLLGLARTVSGAWDRRTTELLLVTGAVAGVVPIGAETSPSDRPVLLTAAVGVPTLGPRKGDDESHVHATPAGGVPHCSNCDAFVTEAYVAVSAPDGLVTVRTCPHCEDVIRDGAEVRGTRHPAVEQAATSRRDTTSRPAPRARPVRATRSTSAGQQAQ